MQTTCTADQAKAAIQIQFGNPCSPINPPQNQGMYPCGSTAKSHVAICESRRDIYRLETIIFLKLPIMLWSNITKFCLYYAQIMLHKFTLCSLYLSSYCTSQLQTKDISSSLQHEIQGGISQL